MKLTSISILLALFSLTIKAQTNAEVEDNILVNENVSTHFLSTQILKYTDISTAHVVGDLPLPNVLRIRPKEANEELGYITIAGEGYLKVYKLTYTSIPELANKKVIINQTGINSEEEKFVDMTSDMMRNYTQMMFDKGSSNNGIVSKKYGLKMKLHNIWVVNNTIFIDYSLYNQTNLNYTFDEIRYKIQDRKITKRTSIQDLEIQPLYSAGDLKEFERKKRIIAVFDKFTFPSDKTFSINVAEEQISGREIRLDITYKDILNAKTFKY